MPIQVSDPDIWQPRPADPVTPPPEVEGAAGAAWRTESIVGSFMARDKERFKPEPGFDALLALDDVDPKYAPFMGDLAETQSEAAFIQKLGNIDRQLKDRETIANAGGKGIAWSVAAGVLDPISLASMFIPAIGEARLGILGKNVTKLAGETAALAGGTAAIEEGLLHSTQEARTWQESVAAVGGSVVLGGLLGGAAGLLSRKELNAMASEIAKDLNDLATNKGMVNADKIDTQKSMGAAQAVTLEGEGTDLSGPAFSPLVRLIKNESKSARNTVNRLLRHNLFTGKNKRIEEIKDAKGNVVKREVVNDPNEIPAEVRIDRDIRGLTVKYIEAVHGNWKAYAKRVPKGERISREEFMEAIGKAMRRGDEWEIPEVAKAAGLVRGSVFEPLAKRYQAMGDLPEDLHAPFAKSYFSRLYDVRKIDENYDQWMNLLTRNFRADLLDGQDLAKLDPDARASAERAASFEARKIAIEVTHKIKNTPLGQIQRDLLDGVGGAGALKQRTLNIPDEQLEPFLHSNVDRVLQHHIRTMVPELNLKETFGSHDLVDQLQEIANEFDELINAAKTAKERKRLGDQRDSAMEDIRGVRDVMLGRFALPQNRNSRLLMAGRLSRSMTFMAQLGMMTLSAIPDLARPIMQHGFRQWAKALPKSFSQAAAKVKLEQKAWRQVGIGTDNYLNSRLYLMGDLDFSGEVMERQTARFAKLTGMNAWNTAMKTIAANVAQNRFIDDAIRYAKLSPKRREALAKAGIGRGEAAQIAKQVEKHGEKFSGSWIANTDQWDDKELAGLFETILLKDVDNTIVTPSAGDKPLLLQYEVGKMIAQFKSFFLAAHNQVTVPLAQSLSRGDLNAVTGITAAIGMGMIAEMARLHLSGRGDELLTYSEADWLRAGLDRSGVLSVPMELFNITDRAAGGRMSSAMGLQEGSRYFMRNTFGTVAGPAMGYLEDLYGIAVEPLQEGDQFTSGDLHSIRRLMPYQNHFALRALLDRMEGGITQKANLPLAEERKRSNSNTKLAGL